jgi:NAD(P)-dependent dehydrogenase (short-subunit alcohol dehydrogenase family)
MVSPHDNQPRRTLLLTGASRGIGHATVKRFSAAGWRVITCSRHRVPGELSVGEPGPRITSRSTSPIPTTRCGDRRDQAAARHGELHALVNNAAISPKARAASGCLDRTPRRRLDHVFQVNFFAPIMLARGLLDELKAARARSSTSPRSRLARASVRGRRLLDLEGGARRAHARNGGRFRSARHPRQRDRARRDRHRDPVARHRGDRSASDPDASPRHADEVAKIIYVLCTETSSYVNGAEIHINGGQHV